MAQPLILLIKFDTPNNRQNDSNGQEEEPCHKNTAIILLFGLTELTRAVIGVAFVLGSTHGDKGEHDVSENESDTDEGAFAADEEQARKEGHQNTRNEEGICHDLEIDCRAIGEKALCPNHEKADQDLNSKTNSIFDELDLIFLFHCK